MEEKIVELEVIWLQQAESKYKEDVPEETDKVVEGGVKTGVEGSKGSEEEKSSGAAATVQRECINRD